MPRIFWIIVGVATALAIFLVLFLLLRGFQDGQRQSEAQRRQQIAIYLQNGRDAADEDNQQLALEAFRRVLILDPENEEAIAGIGNLLNRPASQPSPAAVIVVPTPTPDAPIPTPTSPNPLAVTWADAQNLYNAGRWEESIVRLRQVRLVDANFERARVEEMLFTAYVSLGTEKSNGGSLEEAVTLFDRALEIRPNAAEIRAMRNDTAQYLDALTYWFADWAKVIELLDDLYARNSGYRDVGQRLQKAHLEYADTLSRQSDWCSAAEEYTAAINVQNAPGLVEKQAEFQTLCAQNPGGLADAESGDPAAVGVTGAADAPAPAITGGFGSGRILYAAMDVVDNRYRIYAQPVTASVRPVMLVEDALQPALRGDGQRLAFRNIRGDQRGLGSYDPGTGLRLRFTNYAEDSFPSWNGEGNQLVFASDREGDRRWRIYTAWADGNDNGVSLGYGQYPQWHTGSNRIVFRGCDERGNACGLWIMNGSGGDRVPLTSVPGDSHPTWSPDGRYVVFMSQERSGSWEIYRVDVQNGAVLGLTTDASIDGLPAVSPDSSRVAFLSNRDGSWKIWIKPINGGADQLLAPITGELPNWMEHKIQWVP